MNIGRWCVDRRNSSFEKNTMKASADQYIGRLQLATRNMTFSYNIRKRKYLLQQKKGRLPYLKRNIAARWPTMSSEADSMAIKG